MNLQFQSIKRSSRIPPVMSLIRDQNGFAGQLAFLFILLMAGLGVMIKTVSGLNEKMSGIVNATQVQHLVILREKIFKEFTGDITKCGNVLKGAATEDAASLAFGAYDTMASHLTFAQASLRAADSLSWVGVTGPASPTVQAIFKYEGHQTIVDFAGPRPKMLGIALNQNGEYWAQKTYQFYALTAPNSFLNLAGSNTCIAENAVQILVAANPLPNLNGFKYAPFWTSETGMDPEAYMQQFYDAGFSTGFNMNSTIEEALAALQTISVEAAAGTGGLAANSQ